MYYEHCYFNAVCNQQNVINVCELITSMYTHFINICTVYTDYDETDLSWKSVDLHLTAYSTGNKHKINHHTTVQHTDAITRPSARTHGRKKT